MQASLIGWTSLKLLNLHIHIRVERLSSCHTPPLSAALHLARVMLTLAGQFQLQKYLLVGDIIRLLLMLLGVTLPCELPLLYATLLLFLLFAPVIVLDSERISVMGAL